MEDSNIKQKKAYEDLQTVKFLREHGLKKLVEKYSLTERRHKDYPNIVLLKYDQLASNMGSKIVQECRGLILDENDNWKVLSFPYNKFFNYNEGHAVKIDWKTAKVYEKLDGSLAILYCYKSEWIVASSGRPDAMGYLNKSKGTDYADWKFMHLFWDIWKQKGYILPKEENMCFMFELFSRKNQVIVTPREDNIVLHGVRNIDTLEELDPVPFASKYGYNIIKSFDMSTFKTMEEVITASKSIDPSMAEGYVICDGNFNRVKIKSPQYVCMSLMSWKDKDGLNKRRMLEVVRANEGDEFISYFPEWKELYYHLKMRFEELITRIEDEYQRIERDESLKDMNQFGRYMNTLHEPLMKTALFKLRKKESSVRHYLSTAPIKSLEQALPKEDINTLPTKLREELEALEKNEDSNEIE